MINVSRGDKSPYRLSHVQYLLTDSFSPDRFLTLARSDANYYGDWNLFQRDTSEEIFANTVPA
jgi:hypothetical protein